MELLARWWWQELVALGVTHHGLLSVSYALLRETLVMILRVKRWLLRLLRWLHSLSRGWVACLLIWHGILRSLHWLIWHVILRSLHWLIWSALVWSRVRLIWRFVHHLLRVDLVRSVLDRFILVSCSHLSILDLIESYLALLLSHLCLLLFPQSNLSWSSILWWAILGLVFFL